MKPAGKQKNASRGGSAGRSARTAPPRPAASARPARSARPGRPLAPPRPQSAAPATRAKPQVGAPITGKANLILCVIQRGKANQVARAAMDAGASGATVFAARGMGVGEIVGALGFPIAPQKEIVMIVASEGMTRKIFDVVRKAAELDTLGMGIGCVLPIADSAGLFEAKTELAG